jgi:hypothetical protein
MPRIEPNISRKKLFKLLGYEPHSEEQWSVHDAKERFRVACCGRRWGKTTVFGHEMTLKMFVPDSINWIVGPEYGLGEKEFRVVWNDFKKLDLLGFCDKSYNPQQGNMRIYFKEINSLCQVVSAQRPDSLVGEGLDHVIMSEAAKHSLSTWQMYIQPALSDKRGSADFPSTPQGFNWYQAMYDFGQSSDKHLKEYASWRLPTWTNIAKYPKGFNVDCPDDHNTPECQCDEELLMIYKNVTTMYWEQEYAALFTSFTGMIYDEFDENIHVREFEYDSGKSNWLGLDFGYVDPFVCLDIMIDHNQRKWVWREYVVSYKSTHDHGLILRNREQPKGYHIDGVAADPRGADEAATLQWLFGPILRNDVGRSLGYEAIKRDLKVRPDGLPGLIIHPRCTELRRQMKRLRTKEPKEGHNSKQVIEQVDYDDHTCDALRYFYNEYVVLGGSVSLSDVYNKSYAGSEAEGFFTYTSGFNLDRSIGF